MNVPEFGGVARQSRGPVTSLSSHTGLVAFGTTALPGTRRPETS